MGGVECGQHDYKSGEHLCSMEIRQGCGLLKKINVGRTRAAVIWKRENVTK